MQTAGIVILFGLMAATALVLLVGIGMMARGGEVNRKYGNKMMVLRVSLQAATLVAFAAVVAMKANHS